MPATKYLLALAAAAACMGASAQTATATADAQARYKQERAACMNGTSHQDRATCLREAGAALYESKRGGLTSSAQLEANATARCAALPEADRADCRARVMNSGETTVTGSVEGGGVLREHTTRWVETPEGRKQVP